MFLRTVLVSRPNRHEIDSDFIDDFLFEHFYDWEKDVCKKCFASFFSGKWKTQNTQRWTRSTLATAAFNRRMKWIRARKAKSWDAMESSTWIWRHRLPRELFLGEWKTSEVALEWREKCSSELVGWSLVLDFIEYLGFAVFKIFFRNSFNKKLFYQPKTKSHGSNIWPKALLHTSSTSLSLNFLRCPLFSLSKRSSISTKRNNHLRPSESK